MEYAVISDIHGNAMALEAVIADAKGQGCDNFLLLGDYFDGGPMPRETYDLLMGLDIIPVPGNHDIDLLEYGKGLLPTWDSCCLYDSMKWTFRHMDPTMTAWLASMGMMEILGKADGIPICINHGRPGDAYSKMPGDPETIKGVLRENGSRVLLCGHTHEQAIQALGGLLYLNPGSVGAAHSPYAEYATLRIAGDQAIPCLRQVPYDIDSFRAAYGDRGYLSEGGICAELNMLSLGLKEHLYFPFVGFLRDYAAEQGMIEKNAIPDRIWRKGFESWKRGNGF